MLSGLTKDALRLLAVIYREYRQRIDSGMSIKRAMMFGSSGDIQKDLLPKASVENVDHWCRELYSVQYLSGLFADGEFYFVQLTDLAIRDMENRFKDNLKGLADLAAQFI